jgi:redox-sensing transcriptional repressor
MIPERTIGRISLYRRALRDSLAEGSANIYSHELAARCGVTSAQVRRDLMHVGYNGSPNRGYMVRELLDSIDKLLDPQVAENVALVGVGNLGRAILAYFGSRGMKLRITAAFDKDPTKAGRVFHGCRCYGIEEAAAVIPSEGILSVMLTVPASEAQGVADLLVAAGVRGIVNFAPVRLRVPPEVCVENMDFTTSLERVAFFARGNAMKTEPLRL